MGAAKCNIIAFDKTRTLTTGKLTCASVENISSNQPICDVDTALAIAASLERGALHPISEAICIIYAQQQGSAQIPIEDF